MSFHLDKNEYIIFEARRNWIVLWGKTIGLLFSILIPIFIFSLLGATNFVTFSGNKDALFMVFVLSWIFLVWNLMFVAWTDHYLDIFVITNKNLIDIEQKGIFNREVSVLSLDKIQDITTKVGGFVPTVIGYGDLFIQTAGSEKEFILKSIDKPNFVRSKIKEAISGEVSKEDID